MPSLAYGRAAWKSLRCRGARGQAKVNGDLGCVSYHRSRRQLTACQLARMEYSVTSTPATRHRQGRTADRVTVHAGRPTALDITLNRHQLKSNN